MKPHVLIGTLALGIGVAMGFGAGWRLAPRGGGAADGGASPALAGVGGPRAGSRGEAGGPEGCPKAKRVLVRVPAGECECEDDPEAQARRAGEWNDEIPDRIRPKAFAKTLEQVMEELELDELPMTVDCAAYPCLVITDRDADPEAKKEIDRVTDEMRERLRASKWGLVRGSNDWKGITTVLDPSARIGG